MRALLLLTLPVLVAPLGSSALAQGQNRLDPDIYPEPAVFRQLQLETMACGRENSSEPCQKARAIADPLMDHPKLPTACKDSLWSILEKAKVAPSNTYTRRETLNKEAIDLIGRCKPSTKPLGDGSQTRTEEKKSGGLGGFLRGLGIGGSDNAR